MAKTIDPLVVIVGETASGKSSLAMFLARKFNGEIISADSRAIYKGMDIGTAKPTKQDQSEIPHHLIDIINPNQRYSAKQFKEDATKVISDILSRGKLPIMVGGTGLYIDAVLFDYRFDTAIDKRDPHNLRHALPSVLEPSISSIIRPSTLVLGIKLNREDLNNNIQQRAKQMLSPTLVQEVTKLIDKYGADTEPMSGIGYKTFVRYVRGDLSMEEAKDELVRGDKSLAKRQRTWFKRNKSIHWITRQSEAVELVTTLLHPIE